jgi:hypothetical protein
VLLLNNLNNKTHTKKFIQDDLEMKVPSPGVHITEVELQSAGKRRIM